MMNGLWLVWRDLICWVYGNWDVGIVPARARGVYVLFLYQLYIHLSDKQGLGTIASLYTYFDFLLATTPILSFVMY
jgi:hypothetical protein